MSQPVRTREGAPSNGRDDVRDGERNALLNALPADSYQRLIELIEPVDLANGQILWDSGGSIRSMYFPRTCVLSFLIILDEELPVESATVGREGMAGAELALGADTSATRVISQVPGTAGRLSAADFRGFADSEPALSRIVLRYAQALQEQTAQSVACNRRHSIEERCARWLLMTHDRVGADEFPLTQEFLAYMLGVRRATVTVAAGMLQKAGFIRYTHGRISVVDRKGLEGTSCECYRVVRVRADRMFDRAFA